MLTTALLGILLGFLGSIPVAGPISLLVLAYGLEGRVRNGLFLALGAALAESMYAYFAFWGFGELLARWPWIEPVSRGLAAVLLITLGVRFLRPRPRPSLEAHPKAVSPAAGDRRSFLLGLTITAFNPTLIATWLAAVTLLRASNLVDFGAGRALAFAMGVAAGIAAWFSVLLKLLGRYQQRFSRSSQNRMLQTMGAVLVLLGVVFAGLFAQFVFKQF